MAGTARLWRVLPRGLLVAGIALRVLAIFRFPVSADASEYAVLARSILQGRGMWVPYGEAWDLTAWTPGPSHQYPPAYPVYLVPFIAALGFSEIAVQVAALVAGIALLAVFFVATRDLFGREKAAWFVALLAVDPVLVTATGTGYAENLITLLFVVTVAAILKSLERPRWILLAGLTDALAYLTKSAVGPFFVIAGVAGFAWRFRFVRWAVFRDRAYLASIGIFSVLAGTWAARNLYWFWDGTAAGLLTDWQTSWWFSLATERAAAMPGDYLWILVVRVPFFAGLFLLIAGPWYREIRSLPFWRDEAASALGLAAGLTYLMAWLISGAFWVLERGPVFWADMTRYVAFANPVVWWMAAKGSDPASPSFKKRFAVAAVVLLVMNGAAFVSPRIGVFEAYSELRERAAPGDTVALDNVNKYEAELHLVGAGVELEPYHAGTGADYILTSNTTRSFDGYALVDVYGSDNATSVMSGYGAALWSRAGDPTRHPRSATPAPKS